MGWSDSEVLRLENWFGVFCASVQKLQILGSSESQNMVLPSIATMGFVLFVRTYL